MDSPAGETDLISFVCPYCGLQIETPPSRANQSSDCPSCARKIRVPLTSFPAGLVAVPLRRSDEQTDVTADAMKSRTICIDLDTPW